MRKMDGWADEAYLWKILETAIWWSLLMKLEYAMQSSLNADDDDDDDDDGYIQPNAPELHACDGRTMIQPMYL